MFRLPGQSVRWLLAELTVIVLGILIAFQVDEWRLGLADRADEKRFLQELIFDLQDDQRVLTAAIEERRQRIPPLRELLVLLSLESTTQADAQHLLELEQLSFGGTDLYVPKTITFDGLVTSGRLTLIENPDLIRQIADYYEMSGFTMSQDELRQKLQGDYFRMFIDFYGALAHVQDFEREFGADRDVFGVPDDEAQVQLEIDVESRKNNKEFLRMLGEAQQLQEYYEYRYREQLEKNEALQDAINRRIEQL